MKEVLNSSFNALSTAANWIDTIEKILFKFVAP